MVSVASCEGIDVSCCFAQNGNLGRRVRGLTYRLLGGGLSSWDGHLLSLGLSCLWSRHDGGDAMIRLSGLIRERKY
jgi:hypothetical protein